MVPWLPWFLEWYPGVVLGRRFHKFVPCYLKWSLVAKFMHGSHESIANCSSYLYVSVVGGPWA